MNQTLARRRAPLPNPNEPDRLEKQIRFACGFLVGLALAFFGAIRVMHAFTSFFWALVFGIAFLFGYFAMRRGDPFWYGLSNFFRWWC